MALTRFFFLARCALASFGSSARYQRPSSLAPVEVVAQLIVDGTGRVETARIIRNDGDAAFADAVLAAVRGWTFYPLQRVTGRVVEPLPFTQDYRFRFRQENGRAVVETR